MTLVISVSSRFGAWQAADRRYGNPAPKSFLANKICKLETPDSFGFISYSGLGAMILPGKKPFELSKWIHDSLRGRKLTLDQTQMLIAYLAKERKIPDFASDRSHLFQWAGFLNGNPTIYSLGTQQAVTQFNPKNNTEITKKIGSDSAFGWHRLESRTQSVLIACHGSGHRFVKRKELKKIFKLAKEARRSQNHERRVGVYLASLIKTASEREKNTLVSPESLVVTVLPDKTGWHQAYDRFGKRDLKGHTIPTIANGFPVDQIVDAAIPTLLPHMTEVMNAMEKGLDPPKFDESELTQAIQSVETAPDDSFLASSTTEKPTP